jgi:uncharacterized membrane protein
MFETRLGLRMDYEACLAYLVLPPAGPVVLLMLEHRSDYVRYVVGVELLGSGEQHAHGANQRFIFVRFHAWQSSLLFAFIFVVHIIFSWSSIISWFLFVGDLALIAYLTVRAYQDGEFCVWKDLLAVIHGRSETMYVC